MYQFALDYESSTVRIKNSGLWTPREGDAYVVEFGRNIALLRKRCAQVRVLVDARDAEVHPTETVQAIIKFDRHIDNKTDRMAIVVATSLKKQQVARTTPSCAMAFLSIDAARLWLFAHDHYATDGGRLLRV